MSSVYFNEEIQTKIREMSSDEMNSLLLDLESTQSWIAILKYLQERMISAQNGLLTIDAVKEAGKIAQLQGVMAGLSDLQNAVIYLKDKAEGKNQPTQENNSEKIDS